ncbi:MAG TPA: lipoyl synthase [Dehalococcoidia bacterium]|nr:lipoyl synthase [Dehalococcoidia bacterium]
MRARLPSWFRQPPVDPEAMVLVEGLLNRLSLHTICESAHCPNAGDCFSRKTATFLILGNICTRNCSFCAVAKGRPLAVDDEEPEHLLAALEKLGLRYVVITSVTRDDLDDGGASHFARTVRLIHQRRPGTLVEVLIPDFRGSFEALRVVAEARPEVINHNVETVPRLYPRVRAMADYRRSVRLLSQVKDLEPGIVTKSGLMLGLGETREEVVQVMKELREARCDLLTLGQYLPPSEQHYPLSRFVTPEEFSELAATGRELGFAEVASAPLVRSSFKAAELYAKARN